MQAKFTAGFDDSNYITTKDSIELHKLSGLTDFDDFVVAYEGFCSEYREHIESGDGPMIGLKNFIKFRLNGGSVQEYKDEHERGFSLIDFHKSLSEKDCQAVLDRLYAEGVLANQPKLLYLNEDIYGGPVAYFP